MAKIDRIDGLFVAIHCTFAERNLFMRNKLRVAEVAVVRLAVVVVRP